jgi:hypothetical protein
VTPETVIRFIQWAAVLYITVVFLWYVYGFVGVPEPQLSAIRWLTTHRRSFSPLVDSHYPF